MTTLTINDNQQGDTQHLSVIMLSTEFSSCYAVCHYAEFLWRWFCESRAGLLTIRSSLVAALDVTKFVPIIATMWVTLKSDSGVQ